MQKVLVLGLGGQGQKYLNYFLKNNYEVFGVCRTEATKEKIENQYKIPVFLEYNSLLEKEKIDTIIVSLPPEVQGQMALELVEKYQNIKVIVEIPVSWDSDIVEQLKTYKNCIFYLEEYFTLLGQFLRKIDASLVEKINIKITVSKDDYENEKASRVTHIHIMNNFLGSGLNEKNLHFTYNFHEREDIFYEVAFEYKGVKIFYVFNQEKYLMIGEKQYSDEYNFDFVLGKLLEGGLGEDVKEEYFAIL